MAAKSNVGTLIREARTAKKLSQEQLAIQVEGLSANDISKAERGEKELSQAQLRAIAKVTGVTQKSLLEAPKGGIPGNVASAQKTVEKSTATRKTASASGKQSVSTAKKSSGRAGKASTSNAGESEKLSAAEKKVVELYRAAKPDNKKLATKILRGETLELGDLLPLVNSEDGILGGFIGKLQDYIK